MTQHSWVHVSRCILRKLGTETTCGDVTVNEATTLASLAIMYILLCHLGTIELPFEDTFMKLLPKNQQEGCIKANEIVRINPCGYKTKYT